MDKFQGTHSFPRLSEEEKDKLNRLITRSEIESVIWKKKKNHCKQMSRTGWLHWGILPNIQRTYNYPSQAIPKNWRGGNTCKFILWGHHHLDTKDRYRHYKRRKLQAYIFDEYRCNNSQQNISKLNLTIHKIIIHDGQVGFIPGSQEWFNICKSINVIHYITKGKTKIHDHLNRPRKTFDKIQHPLMIKTFINVCIEET